MYELLCTARTRAGQARLAQYLLERARADEVRARQGAVRELAPALDLREEVDALADHVADYAAGKGGDEGHLLAWAARDASMPAWLLPAAALFVATSLTTLALAALDVVPSLVPAIVLAAQAGFAALVRKRANATLEGAEHADDELKVLAGLLARIETMDVQAPLLASLHARLLTEGERPSRVVARLTAHLDRLRQQQNQFFIPIASVLLWRTVHAALIGRWRRKAGPRLPEWIAVVAEVEALLSLATYAYEHPEDIEPVILDAPREGPPTIAGRALGHPLLPGGGVRNDVALGATRLYVVSGSNMSGKSTFLRTIGVNAVLALAGGRVRAQELSLSPLAVGCTLRVQDSLEKGASRFYAEILRLKAIMKLAGEGPLLFLIDELLAGTNSRDRQVGGAAILQGLVARGAIGLASTHDLALAAVAEALGDRARNVHFADVLEGDRVVFDYRLKDGVVDRSNALALMRAVGLDV